MFLKYIEMFTIRLSNYKYLIYLKFNAWSLKQYKNIQWLDW